MIVMCVLLIGQLDYVDSLGRILFSDLEGAMKLVLFIGSIVYVYGIGYSLLVDGAAKLLRLDSAVWRWGLHAIGGYLFFFLFMRFDIWLVLSFGTLGALIASIFFAADRFIRRKFWRLFCAYGAPVLLGLLLIASPYVPATKVGWEEQRTDGRLEASYQFFHGKEPIPIRAEQGQTITFSVDGESGYHVVGPDGELVAMEERAANELAVEVQESGTYTLTIVGNKSENGHITVVWQVQ